MKISLTWMKGKNINISQKDGRKKGNVGEKIKFLCLVGSIMKEKRSEI